MLTMQKRTIYGRKFNLENVTKNLYKNIRLKDLYIKCNIVEYEEVLNNSITIERLKQILKFIEELNLCICAYMYIHVCICVCVYVCMYIYIYIYIRDR